MLIVLEGADNTGKSTLAEMLADECLRLYDSDTVARLHAKAPRTDNGIDEYELPLDNEATLDEIYSLTDLVILDRWHLGELIYGPLLRHKSILNGPMRTHIDMFLAHVGALMIVLHCDNSTLDARYDGKIVSKVQARFVNQWYITNAIGRYRLLDTSRPFGKPEVRQLLNDARNLTLSAIAFRRFPGLVGNVADSALLVGDRRGDGPLSENDKYTRAFTPARHGSASYLLSAIERTGEPHGFSIVNANEDGLELGELCKYTYRVVALGENASKALERANVSHVQIPHPQYWRRFRNMKMREYVEMLRNAACIP